MTTAVLEGGYTFTGWPARPIFSFYEHDAKLSRRYRTARFDLADAICFHHHDLAGFVTFGIISESKVRRVWTLDEVRRQEENIRYDLSEDGMFVDIKRIRGVGLSCREEMLWELHIR